jgi:hypothetical protein
VKLPELNSNLKPVKPKNSNAFLISGFTDDISVIQQSFNEEGTPFEGNKKQDKDKKSGHNRINSLQF